MKKNNTLTLFCLSLLLLASLCSSDVTPDVVLEKVKKGDSVHVVKRVTTPVIPPMIDLVVLQDESASFSNDIALVKGTASDCSDGLGAELFDELRSRTEFSRFGVAGFVDFFVGFETEGWGQSGDIPFELVEDLTDDKDTYLSGICNLGAMGGADLPESQMHAMFQSADLFSWSTDTNVFRALVLITDAAAHTPENTPGYPGPSEAATIAKLQEEKIHVIVLQAPGASGYNAIAAQTGGVVGSISDDSSDIIDALLAALGEITTDLIPVVSDCDPRLTVSFDPPIVEDAAMGEEFIFIETIRVARHFHSHPDELLKCTVNFILMDEEGPSVGEELIFIDPVKKPKKKDDCCVKPRCQSQCCR